MSNLPLHTPRRILMTADTIGGVWTYALELCRGLAKRGIEVALATMGAPLSDSQRKEAAALRNVALFPSNFRLEWMPEPWEDVGHAGEWLIDLEEQIRPDIVHLNNFAHGALPWRAPVMVVGHSCVVSWWQAVKGCAAPPEWNKYRRAVTDGLRAPQLVVAPSNAMMECLVEHYGPFKMPAVIPNGRDFETSPKRSKEPFVLAAGRLWDEAKNIRTLASVARHLPWPLYVAGDEACPDQRGLSCRFSEENVFSLGRLSANELFKWYARAAIYALPARYEPFGLTALEAALCGCALVLGDIPSLREIWSNAALYVAPDTPEGLRRTLQDLINDPREIERLGASARIVAQKYSAERMLAGCLNAYSCLLSKSQSKEDQDGLNVTADDSFESQKGALACAS